MAIEIGIIKGLIGTATATAADGSQRTLQIGDKLFANEIVSTGAAGAVEIEFADGSIMDLGRNSQAVLDNEVFDSQSVTQAPTQVQDDVEALQQALLDGIDPTLVGEATAAGAGTQAGGNEGHAAVTVEFLAPEVDVTSGFDTTGPSFVLPEIVSEDVFDDVPVAIDDGIAGEAGILDASKTVFEDRADFNSAEGTGLGFINSRGEFVPQQTTTGNILANDSFGANGPGGLVSVTYAGSSTGVTGTLIGGVATLEMADPDSPETGPIWTLTVEPNGDYTFTLNKPYVHSGQGEDIAQELFQYTIQDADGDTASATLTFNIVDDVPHIDDYSQQSEGQESLPTAFIPTTSVDESNIGDGYAESLVYLPINFGADGPANIGAVSLSATGIVDQNGQPLFSNDVELTYTWDADTSTLTGMAGDIAVLTMTVVQNVNSYFSESYGVEVRLLDNIDHPISGVEDNLIINIGYTATDFDGDSVDGTFAVDIDDDSPTVSANKSVKLDDDAVTDANGNPGGVKDDPDAVRTTGTLSHSYGADEAGSLLLLDNGAPKGFTYTLNADGTLLTVSQLQDGSSVNVVEMSLTDTSSGDYTVRQLNPIDHKDQKANKENNQDFKVNYQVTDGDGDTVTGAIKVTVDDDSPILIDKSDAITVDEDGLAGANADAARDGEVTGTGSVTATGSLADNFSFGADGMAAAAIVSVNGKTADQDGIITVEADGYRLDVTAETGAYTFTLLSNVLVEGKGENLQDLNIKLTVVAEDGDGDKVKAVIILDVDVLDDVPVITSQAIQSELLLQESFENFRNSDGWNVEGQGGATIVGDHGVEWTTNVAGIEIQRGNVGGSTASDGQSHAELDSHGSGHTTLTVLSTTVSLPYAEAALSFDYKPRPDDKSGSDMKVTLGEGSSAITVTLDAQSNGTVNITSDNGVTVTQVTNPANGWITITLNYGGLAVGATTLSFAGLPDANGGSNTLGAYIDNINMTANAFGLQVDETNLNVDATADFSSLFTSSFGADGAGSIAYTLNVGEGPTGVTDTATGQAVLLSMNENTGAIEGRTVTSDDLVFSLSVDTDGKVTLDQQRAVIHADPANHDDVVSLNPSLINLVATITDEDGDKATAEVDLTASISFRDDGPSVTATQPAAPAYEFIITNHDEVSSAGHHNSYGYYIKDAVTGKPTTGVVVWDDVHDTDTVPVTVTGYTPEQVGFFIIPNGDNKNSGLEDNTPVTFSLVNGQWQAFSGTTPLVGTGANVFFDNAALNTDAQNHVADNGLIGNQNWEDLPIPNGDGDFNDVNINVEWSVTNSRPLTVDETELADGDQATTASATMALAGSFAISPGADGLGSVDYTLGLNSEGADSGVVDTLSDAAVLLRTNNVGDIEGYVADGVVFTLTVDTATGEVTLTQLRAVVHGNAEDHDEALTPATISDNLITMTATVTDGDGDTASDSIDIGVLLAFEDDGPMAVADNEVTTDEDTAVIIDVLANDSVGADNATISSHTQTANGTVVLNEDGTFTYTPSANYSGSDSFSYTLTDGDGDTSIATVSIGVTAVADAPTLIMSVGEPTVTSTQAEGYQVIDYKGDSYFVGGGDSGILKASTNSTHTTFVEDKGYGVGGGSGVDSIDKNESLMFDLQQELSSATFAVSVESASLNAQWIAYDLNGGQVGQGAITSTGTIVISDIGHFAYVAFDAANGGSENNGGFYVMPVSSIDTTNLIVNGSFEDINGEKAGGNLVTGLAEGSLNGTSLVSMQTITGWETILGAPMEPHAAGHAGVGSTDGNHYMDLGASPGNTSIEQTFDSLASGQIYQLSFDFRDKAAMQESGQAGQDSGVMNILWNGLVVGTVQGNNTEAWESLIINVKATGTDSLVFAEVGASDDNWGIAIDNVELFSVYEYNDAPQTSYSYDLSIIAALTDLDGSEILSGITLTGLPTGVTIAEIPNQDGTYNAGKLTLISDHELSGDEVNAILGSVTSTDGTATATTDSNAKVAADYVDFNALSLASWGGSTQDRAASDATTVTENVLTLAGNSWKAVSLDQLGVASDFDWSNGTLTFETKVTTGGELQGILFDNNLDNNNAIDQSNLIKVAGSQSWGTNAAYTSEDLGDGWARVEVDLSVLDQSNGVFNSLVFVNDDDDNDPAGNGEGSISFRNLSISDTAIDSAISTDNLLEGTSGNDALYGDAGNDILIGGAGDDILTGGAGSDIFVWNQEDVSITATPAHDIVMDFDTVNDQLNLADLLSDPSVPHTIEGIATGADHHLQLNIKNGSGAIVQEIELQGVDALAFGANANATLQSLLDTGVINDGI